ncbi:MAG: universal stress protein, partial [Vicinamibacteria bacterium]
KSIVCAVDLRAGGDLAILEADAWARRHEAVLTFVHAIPEMSRSHVLFPQFTQRTFQSLPALTRLTADAVAGRVQRLTGRKQEDLDVRIDTGSPATIIVNVAEEVSADLIVVAAVGGDATIAPLGSVALRTARHAHCPVLVARPSPPGGAVVIATDLSDPTFPAVRAGAFAARALGTSVVVIHVSEFPNIMPVSPDALSPSVTYATNPDDLDALRESAREYLDNALAREGLQGVGTVTEGIPAVAIVSAARRLQAGLIVIGTEGRTGLRRMLLGSTAEQILRDCPCSTLVVRLHSKEAIHEEAADRSRQYPGFSRHRAHAGA